MPQDPHLDRRHLLRVTEDPDTFRELIAALRQAGGRSGWLELADASPPPSLGRAADLGVLRAVAAGEERTVATKNRRGPAVLADLVHEHFRGCAVVLIRGAARVPLLEPAADGWRIVAEDGTRELSTQALVAALRRPRPWPRDPRDPSSTDERRPPR